MPIKYRLPWFPKGHLDRGEYVLWLTCKAQSLARKDSKRHAKNVSLAEYKEASGQ